MMIETTQSQRRASPTGPALHDSGEEIDMTIYIYSNETGEQIAHHTAETNEQCEQWAMDQYGSNDYHWSYCDVEQSNAV